MSFLGGVNCTIRSPCCSLLLKVAVAACCTRISGNGNVIRYICVHMCTYGYGGSYEQRTVMSASNVASLAASVSLSLVDSLCYMYLFVCLCVCTFVMFVCVPHDVTCDVHNHKPFFSDSKCALACRRDIEQRTLLSPIAGHFSTSQRKCR